MEGFKEGRIELYVIDGRTPFNDSEIIELEVIAEKYCNEKGTSCIVKTRFVKLYAYEKTKGFQANLYHIVGVNLDTGFRWWLGNYNFDEDLHSGKHLDTLVPTENGVVLGYKLWEKFFFEYNVNDIIDIIPKNVSQYEWSGYPVDMFPLEDRVNLSRHSINGLYHVKIIGILEENDETDYFMYLPQKYLLRQFKQYDPINGYYYNHLAIVIDDARQINFNDFEEKLTNVNNKFGGWDNRWELNLGGYQEIENTLDSWLMILTVVFIFIILAGVSNTMTMSVLERRKEIGILKSIGVKKAGIFKIIIIEALLICIIALILGIFIGGLISIYFDINFDPYTGGLFIAPAKITPMVLVSATILTLGFGLLSSIYPARKAFDLEPLEVLRFE
jgi:ABC-type lipoprotein release transport system permease subunit